MIFKKEKIKKELYISKICRKKGWNPKELSTNQMLYIVKNYKS